MEDLDHETPEFFDEPHLSSFFGALDPLLDTRNNIIMLLMGIGVLLLVVAARSDSLECFVGDHLADSWSVRAGDCIQGAPKDGHLHLQQHDSNERVTTMSWTSMRSGLVAPAGGNVTLDLRCSNFMFDPIDHVFLLADRTRAAGTVHKNGTALLLATERDVTMESITASVVRRDGPIDSSCMSSYSAVSVRDSKGNLLEMHRYMLNGSEWLNHLNNDMSIDVEDAQSDMFDSHSTATSKRDQQVGLVLIYQDEQERHYKLESNYLLLVNGDQTASLYDGLHEVATVQVSGYSQLRVTDSPYLATRNIPGISCSIEVSMIVSGKRQVIPCDGEPHYGNSTSAAMETNARNLQTYCPLTQACGVNGRVICWQYR